METKTDFMEKANVLRYPRLDTVLMVEEHIRQHDGEYREL